MSKKITAEDKLRIVKLYHKGKPTKKIQGLFPVYSTFQIAAILAHMGMGTYDDPEDTTKY